MVDKFYLSKSNNKQIINFDWVKGLKYLANTYNFFYFNLLFKLLDKQFTNICIYFSLEITKIITIN